MVTKNNNTTNEQVPAEENKIAPIEKAVYDPSMAMNLAGFKAAKGEEIEGMEVVDETDLKLPKIKLLQATSKEVADNKGKAGQFYNTVTEVESDSIECTLLVLGKSRVMWKQPFKRGEEPLCRSFDGKVKFDGKMQCKNCEYQDWDKAKSAGKNKPDCNMGYVWLAVNHADNRPFRLIASGSSVSNTKNLINEMSPKKYPAYCYNTVLTSKKEQNDSGIFFVICYEWEWDKTGMPTQEQAANAQELSIGMKDLFMRAIELDTTTADDETASQGSSEEGQLF